MTPSVAASPAVGPQQRRSRLAVRRERPRHTLWFLELRASRHRSRYSSGLTSGVPRRDTLLAAFEPPPLCAAVSGHQAEVAFLPARSLERYHRDTTPHSRA